MPTQNYRWGPCPHCGESGWENAGNRGERQFNHDRPQGGRCRKAEEDGRRGGRKEEWVPNWKPMKPEDFGARPLKPYNPGTWRQRPAYDEAFETAVLFFKGGMNVYAKDIGGFRSRWAAVINGGGGPLGYHVVKEFSNEDEALAFLAHAKQAAEGRSGWYRKIKKGDRY